MNPTLQVLIFQPTGIMTQIQTNTVKILVFHPPRRITEQKNSDQSIKNTKSDTQ